MLGDMARHRSWSTSLHTLAGLSLATLPLLACGDDLPSAQATDTGTTGTASTTADSSTTDDALPEPPPEVDWPRLDCDPLVPTYCAAPFPSNVLTIADDSTPTGRRVALSQAAMPTSYYGEQADPTPWSRLDGFSTGTAMLAHLPSASSAGLPDAAHVERSLEDGSPTVLLDTVTGERVAHFAELDATAAEPEERMLIIRPAQRLASARRYIVAIRDVIDAAGVPLPASPAFAALRDLQPSGDEQTEARRPLYTDVFARLADAGVARESLQLAWDFTTASTTNDTGFMLHMRDEGLALAGDPPPYAITSAESDWDPRVAWRLRGTFDVPLYLDVPGPVSVMTLGDDGLPEPSGTATFELTLLIPQSATTGPAALLQFGHGLLGTQAEIERDHFLDFIDAHGYAIFATDWIGLSAPDELFLGAILDSGRIQEFEGVFARTMQAMLNALVLERVVAQGIATEPAYAGLLDPDHRYYYGISLGGILGTMYMSLTTDVERGVVDVMGAPFGAIISRSTPFDPFFAIASATYDDPRDIQLALAMIQMLWDRADPSSYLPHLRADPLPGTLPHDLLMRAALGDHAVPNASATYMARSLAAPHVDTGIRDVFGLTTVDEAEGLAYVEYDFGLPPDPPCNLPQRACNNPHGALRGLPPADAQLDQFLRTGTATSTCDGPCRFPELGGCTGDEPEPTNACVP